jgi:hypothetical protein
MALIVKSVKTRTGAGTEASAHTQHTGDTMVKAATDRHLGKCTYIQHI